MKQFKIGLQLFSVRDEMEKDFEGTLAKVAEMGYEYVEFGGYYGRSAEEIKALLDKYGLKCISVHQGIEWFLEEGQKAVDYLKTFGVKYSIVPWYDHHKNSPKWEQTLVNFSRVGELLAVNDMKLGYHNHDFEFGTYEGKYLFDWLFDTIPGDLIEPEIDTCWVHYAGLNPADFVRKNAGRIHVVHLKDFSCDKLGGGPVYTLIDKDGKQMGSPDQDSVGFRFRPIGEGIQDWDAILSACDDAGAEYLIVEQDDSYEDSELEACARSRKYLREHFGL